MNIFRDIFFILGGISISIGLLSLLAGLFNRSSKIYLYFGIFSIGAGIYYLVFNWNDPELAAVSVQNRILISFAAVYYVFFPWFIAEFTQHGRRTVPLILSLLIITGYLVYLFTGEPSVSMTWQIIVHVGSIGIGIYGIFTGWKISERSNIPGMVFTASMVLFLFLLIGEMFDTYAGIKMIPKLGGIYMPLDLFPVLFIFIMTGTLIQDLAQKYKLQIQVTEKDKKWSVLMDNVGLVIVELDTVGKIEYVNAFYESLTGYKRNEVLGKNWFDLMVPQDQRKKMIEIHMQKLENDVRPAYQNPILAKNGRQLVITWSNLPLNDEKDSQTGVLSIGFDQTLREEQINEIKELKMQLEKENLILQEEITRRSGGLDIIGESTSIKYAINKAFQVAPMDSTVLLEGETGVGKELFADLIHSMSQRHQFPFHKINCAAIPRELIESELFGHKRGAFTGAVSDKKGLFQLSDRGTLFLDEISTMPLALQSKLLRVLQNGEFHPVGGEETIRANVRIIAATNENLKTATENGNFRKDLYYRLNVYPITIPPLRQRIEDIPMLISHFLAKIGHRLNKNVGKVSKADMEKLMAYGWPGNVREMENWVERAIISSSGENLEFAFDQTEKSTPVEGVSMEDILRQVIIDTLEDCNWKINGNDGAANRLKMHPSTLRSKMKKLSITRSE